MGSSMGLGSKRNLRSQHLPHLRLADPHSDEGARQRSLDRIFRTDRRHRDDLQLDHHQLHY